MKRNHFFILIAAFAAFLLAAPPAHAGKRLAKESIYFNGKDFTGGQIIVPEPDLMDAKRWVVVDAHGVGGPSAKNGNKLLGYGYVPTDKVIVLVPKFEEGYHMADDAACKELITRFEWIKERHKVHDKMFLHGFSGGAQFVHRFAFKHPELVVGVSAHSAGSWSGVEGWGEINDKAKDIPFFLTCGDNDRQKAFNGTAPYSRIEWMKNFAAQLKERGFNVRTHTWPGRGHMPPPREAAAPMVREFFLFATEGAVPQNQPGNS
ncbi:alpha/beta hydrolase [Haloferula sp. A504]|uniref:alpha/beta hydrolase n=1 Tax=Haloferula sp. A504 TaxID=3373601 RepID=UPI0031CBD0AA|nr:hypothetical protein [Verrucomicrobiaceae bacterium E54]